MKIKELLDSETKWTKGSMAKDKEGNAVPYGSQEATCYCLLGAAHLCYSVSPEVDVGDSKFYEIRNKMYDKIQAEYGCSGVMGFNDLKADFAMVRKLIEELDV